MTRRGRLAAVAVSAVVGIGAGLMFTLPAMAEPPEPPGPSPADQIIGGLPPLPAAPADAFYTPPAELPAGEPGDVIRSQPIATPTFPNMNATQVMYLSTNQAGDTVPVTGVLMRPILSPLQVERGGDAPVVTVAHGTFGLGEHCAPSKFANLTTADPRQVEYQAPQYEDYMARGITLFVTDYLGGGTPLEQEYLVGRSEGNNVLDGARAAQRLDEGDDLTEASPVGIDGYSQGAQAAAWATEIQPDYAPDLQVKGSFIDAPPHNMQNIVQHFNGNVTTGSGIALAAIGGVGAAYPELNWKDSLNDFGRDVYERLNASCLAEEFFTFGSISIDDVSDPDLSQQPEVRDALAESLLGTTAPGVPSLITGGSIDLTVPPAEPRNLFSDWCQFDGVDVSYRQMPGQGHLDQRPVASALVGIPFLAEKLAGAPAEPGCRELPPLPVAG